jgi:4-amino-4-deoxy-L-arabinose transferase-like glycosyltransferase/peptidoglycan/xylan/chitin deacetylase (PgdA/CDA1 family)
LNPVKEKDVLRLMHDGPSLTKLTERISQEYREEIPPRFVGEILVALQNRGHVFLEEGRWWRTSEGVSFLEQLRAGVPEREEFKKEKEVQPALFQKPAGHAPGGMSRDLAVALALSLAVLVFKLYFAYGYLLPTWDGAIYLLNARRFLYGYDPFAFFELLRPPFLPYLISLLWRVFGENYWITVLIQPVFTVAAGLVLYLVIQDMFDWKAAMLSLFIFLFNPTVFMWTNQLLTHGVELLFTMICILLAWKICVNRPGDLKHRFLHPVLIGVFGALTSLTRYPAIVFFPALLILVLNRKVLSDLRFLLVSGLTFAATWVPWLMWNVYSASGDPFASVKAAFAVGANVGEIEPWYFYLTGLIDLVTVVGVILLLVGIVRKKSFTERRTLVFLGWFVFAIAAHSAFVNKQLRFAIEWFPPIAILIALGVRRIQGVLSFKPKAVFNILLGVWLAYLIGSTMITAINSVSNTNTVWERELPTVAAWAKSNMAKSDIGAADLFAPHLNYFAGRYFYSIEYIEGQSNTTRKTLHQLMIDLNVTYVIATSMYVQARKLDQADYLTAVKRFQNFVAYILVEKIAGRHMEVVVVSNYVSLTSNPSEPLAPSLAIQETMRSILPRFEIVNSSFFSRLQNAYTQDGEIKYGLIVLTDEVWSETSQRLSLDQQQLSVLRTLVEDRGVSLLTSGKSTQGWIRVTRGINSTGTSSFSSFHIAESTRIPGWSNLYGPDRTWNVSSPSQSTIFSTMPEGLETIVETVGRPSSNSLLWVGYQGKGRIAYFCCSASVLSFDRLRYTVNPVLIRVMFWLLGDYPRTVKGTSFKVALRIDDAQAALYSSIQKHASTLTYERGIPLSLSVIPKDLTDATATSLRQLKAQGCELLLHGYPGHYDILTMPNQTQALLEGRDAFQKWLGFYPTVLAPVGQSYNYRTVQAAQALGFKAISGATIEWKPPEGRGNHFGYPYSNSTVIMLPTLPPLDDAPYAGWYPSQETAIARTKWLLASQKMLYGNCIILFHLNDTRLPEIARLTDWVKSIGGEFTTLEQMTVDTFMSPSLEQYSPYSDASNFLSFDMIQNGQSHTSTISFNLNQPIKLRIDAGEEIAYYKVDGMTQTSKGRLIVTELLEQGKVHTVLIQFKASSR